MAGSGNNLAITQAIADRYMSQGGPRVIIPESIGTGGALKALGEGAIEIGLASRPLTDKEKSAGFMETPLGRVPFAAAVRRDLGITKVSTADLEALFSGKRERWQAAAVVPLLREAGDSGLRLIAQLMPGLAEAMQQANRAELGILCYTDQQVRDNLVEVAGAIGFIDRATLILEKLPMVALTLDNVEPSAANVLTGRYSLEKTLTFITRGPPQGEAKRFIDFARSRATFELLRLAEIVPMGESR